MPWAGERPSEPPRHPERAILAGAAGAHSRPHPEQALPPRPLHELEATVPRTRGRVDGAAVGGEQQPLRPRPCYPRRLRELGEDVVVEDDWHVLDRAELRALTAQPTGLEDVGQTALVVGGEAPAEAEQRLVLDRFDQERKGAQRRSQDGWPASGEGLGRLRRAAWPSASASTSMSSRSDSLSRSTPRSIASAAPSRRSVEIEPMTPAVRQ